MLCPQNRLKNTKTHKTQAVERNIKMREKNTKTHKEHMSKIKNWQKKVNTEDKEVAKLNQQLTTKSLEKTQKHVKHKLDRKLGPIYKKHKNT